MEMIILMLLIRDVSDLGYAIVLAPFCAPSEVSCGSSHTQHCPAMSLYFYVEEQPPVKGTSPGSSTWYICTVKTFDGKILLMKCYLH
jgi:hypothetical protein